MNDEKEQAKIPPKGVRLNFRPLLFCAVSLAFGIFLYGRIRFGGFAPSDLVFLILFGFFMLRPLRLKRIALAIAVFFAFAGLGAGLLHGYTQAFLSGKEGAQYGVSGTAISVTAGNGYTSVVLGDLFFDGEETGGKMRVTLGEEIRAGDVVYFTAYVTRVSLDDFANNTLTQSRYVSGIRYTASVSSYQATGKTKNPFLRLNAALYDVLDSHMEREEAQVSYALLTGNSGAMDDGVTEVARKGGIAHIFAVSGLHIGILYSAAYLCFRPIGRYRFIPAIALAFCYCALCAFTASSLRAVLMCAVLGTYKAIGRKTDFLQSVSFAAVVILTCSPAQWFSVGFRLSFGACLGLALFSGSFSRLFAKLRLPRMLRGYLAANLSVQLFTFPILIESFGYFSVWGFLLNLVVVPLLPVLFLGLLICAALALSIAPAAAFFLAFPEAALALFLLFLSEIDVSLVVTGFSLGTGMPVWLIGCVALSQRFRLKFVARTVAATAFAALFCFCVLTENVVFYGCRIDAYCSDGASAVLVRTNSQSVLVIDGDISLSQCGDFLARRYGGTLDGVIILSSEEASAINTAAFLNADEIRALNVCETGLRETNILFGESFSYGEITFRYEGETKLSFLAERIVVELDFEETGEIGADLRIDGSESLIYFLRDGIIKTK